MTDKAARPREPAGRKWIRAVVLAAFVVSSIAALTKIPHVLRAAEPERIPASLRALAPATYYGLDTRLLESAARNIPRSSTYAVVAGGGVRSRFVRVAESALLDYWLLPRRRTDVRSSDWVVSIGGDLQSLGLRYARLVRVGEGMELAERVR
jgi:hypothetical protein